MAESQGKTAALTALVAALSVLLWQALTVHYNFAGNWTGLFCTGRLARIPPDLAAGTIRVRDALGYDGQFYRYVAHDPFFRKGYAAYMDAARLRYSRILVPGLAWALALGRPSYIDAAFNAVILLSIFLGIYWCGLWAAWHSRSPAWGLVFLVLPATLTSMDLMVTDATLAACFGITSTTLCTKLA